MPRWMPSQWPPLNRKSICFAAVSEPSRRVPVSLRFSGPVRQARNSFFPSCSRTASTFAPWPALQRLRKNSTSASSGTLLDADQALYVGDQFPRVEADAVLEDDLGLAQVR